MSAKVHDPLRFAYRSCLVLLLLLGAAQSRASANTNPSITPIANQTLNEDASVTVPFTIGDAETAATGLSLTATTSNVVLTPIARITFGGSGSSRSVTIAPAPNQSGTSNVRVWVKDPSGGTGSSLFTVTVNPVNDNPILTPIANQTLNEDASVTVPFTIGDAETAATGLSLTATTSNVVLTPIARITFGGSGSSRSVTIAPAPNQSGTSSVRVWVKDPSGGTSSSLFTVTVNPVNDNPTISTIGNQTIDANASTAPIPFTIGDVETPPSILNLVATTNDPSLIPLSNVVFGGTGSARTVTITPAPGRSGTANIRVSVNDADGGTNSTLFALTVNPAIIGHSVSGFVYFLNSGMTGAPGVTLSLDTAPSPTMAITDGSGFFHLDGIPDGTYTLTPMASNALFMPASRPVTVAGADVVDLQFQAVMGYSVSGVVSYGGARTGRVYLSLNGGGGNPPGVSIPGPGPFTIRGVRPGTYILNAWMDPLGQGTPNGADPVASSIGITVTGAPLTGLSVTLSDPAPINLTGAGGPVLQGVVPFAGGAFVSWRPLFNASGIEVAEAYRIEWSTNDFGTVTGSAQVGANGNQNTMYFASGLVDGVAYSFRMKALAAGTTSNASSIAKVTIGGSTGGQTISGTVAFEGAATGPLYVGFYDETTGIPYSMRIPNPVSPQAFSLTGVPPGTYFFFGILDQNNDGCSDLGDISNTNSNESSQVIITGDQSGLSLVLPSGAATASVATQHHLYEFGAWQGESYGLQFYADQNVKLPVNVALRFGNAVFDIARPTRHTGFSAWIDLGSVRPQVGDTYTIELGYSDGTSEAIPVSVTAVRDDFPSMLRPITGTSTSLTPFFSWVAPSPVPAYAYGYSLGVWVPNVSDNIWDIDLPASQTSILFNADGGAMQTALSPGEVYQWGVGVTDAHGNMARMNVEYAP